MSVNPLNDQVADFLKDNVELFGSSENKESLCGEIVKVANMLQHDSDFVSLNMDVAVLSSTLTNPPINDIDSDVGNRLGKIFKAFSKNIPMFGKFEHGDEIATIVNAVGNIAKNLGSVSADERGEVIALNAALFNAMNIVVIGNQAALLSALEQGFAPNEPVMVVTNNAEPDAAL